MMHERAHDRAKVLDVPVQVRRILVVSLISSGIKVEQARIREQCFFLDRAMVALFVQQFFHPPNGLACAIMNLHDDLIDFRPIAIINSPEDRQFAFLGINLEEIDFINSILANNFRHRR